MEKPNSTFIMREAALGIGTLVLIAAGAWLLFTRSGEKSLTEDSGEEITIREEGASTISFDTDSDGLQDWEEALWETDPQNRDTDKDGTSDGEEVALRRNPNVAGPKDLLETPLTVIQQKERAVVPEKAPPIITPPIEKPVIPSTEPTIKTQSADSLRVFGNAVGSPIQTAALAAEVELAFWNSAAGTTTMSTKLASGFAELAKKYDQVATAIAAINPAPQAIEIHAALIRAYQNYSKAIQGIASTPLGSYMSGAAITAYADATLALGRAFVAVSDLFYREGVRFGGNEAGAIFMFPR